MKLKKEINYIFMLILALLVSINNLYAVWPFNSTEHNPYIAADGSSDCFRAGGEFKKINDQWKCFCGNVLIQDWNKQYCVSKLKSLVLEKFDTKSCLSKKGVVRRFYDSEKNYKVAHCFCPNLGTFINEKKDETPTSCDSVKENLSCDQDVNDLQYTVNRQINEINQSINPNICINSREAEKKSLVDESSDYIAKQIVLNKVSISEASILFQELEKRSENSINKKELVLNKVIALNSVYNLNKQQSYDVKQASLALERKVYLIQDYFDEVIADTKDKTIKEEALKLKIEASQLYRDVQHPTEDSLILQKKIFASSILEAKFWGLFKKREKELNLDLLKIKVLKYAGMGIGYAAEYLHKGGVHAFVSVKTAAAAAPFGPAAVVASVKKANTVASIILDTYWDGIHQFAETGELDLKRSAKVAVVSGTTAYTVGSLFTKIEPLNQTVDNYITQKFANKVLSKTLIAGKEVLSGYLLSIPAAATRSVTSSAFDQVVDGKSDLTGDLRSNIKGALCPDFRKPEVALSFITSVGVNRVITQTIRNHTANELNKTKILSNISKNISDLNKKLDVKRIRIGSDPQKIAIIGRSMGNSQQGIVGVNDVSEHFKNKGIVVQTFNPSESTWKEFITHANEYRKLIGDKNALLPYDKVIDTKLYIENKKWAENLVKEGYTIVDVGNPNSLQEASPFYDVEKKVVFGDTIK